MTAKRITQSVTTTVDHGLVDRAHDAGLNMSVILMATLNTELERRTAAHWREGNAETIATLSQLADETGCLSDEHRSFQ